MNNLGNCLCFYNPNQGCHRVIKLLHKKCLVPTWGISDEVILSCLLHVITTIDPVAPYLRSEVVKAI